MVNVSPADVSTPPLAVPASSLTFTVTVVFPLALAASVYVRVPLLPIAGCVENNALLSFDTVNARPWPDSFGGPFEIPVAQPVTVVVPLSSSTVWFAPFVNDGTSFTGVTLIVNVCGADVSTPPLSVPPLSCALTVTVAEPLAFAAKV